MRTFYAVARREFLEKRFVLIAAAVAAVIPLIVPLVRKVPGIDASDVRQWLAVLLGSALAGGVAVSIGATVLAGEIANRRIAFFFSRPISSVSLWAGKLASGFLLALATLAIGIGPVLLLDRGLSPLRDFAWTTGRGLAIEVGALLILILAANAVSTIARSHSWLAFVDVLAAPLLVLAAWLAWIPLSRILFEASRWAEDATTAVLIVVVAGLLAGSYRALSHGRTNAEAAHRAFSAALWSVGAAAVAGFLAYSRWVLAAPPSSLSLRSAPPLGSNGWVLLGGRARGFWATFFYDTRTNRFERAPSSTWPVTSANGRVAAWADRESATSPVFIRTLRLDSSGAASIATTISFASRPSPWDQHLFLSPDGDRLGALSNGLLSVFELPSGNSLGSARVADDSREGTSGFFSSRDEIQILRHLYANGSGKVDWEILQFDLPKRTLTHTGTMELQRALWVWPTPSGAQIIVRENLEDPVVRVTLRDSRTGAMIATLHEGPVPLGPFTEDQKLAIAFLSNGSIGLAFNEGERSWIETFSAQGEKRVRISLGGEGGFRIGGEWTAGRLLVGLTPVLSQGREGVPTLEEINLDQATVRRVAEGLRPITWWWMRALPAPGSEATKLFLGPDHALVRFDPATGKRRILLGGR